MMVVVRSFPVMTIQMSFIYIRNVRRSGWQQCRQYNFCSHHNNDNNNTVSSIGYSGAGFLGSYHLGVSECLLKNGVLLPQPGDLPRKDSSGNSSNTILLGVSAGSMTAAAISAGVRPEDGMNVVLGLSRIVKEQGGFLNVLMPGFSLLDHAWDLLVSTIQSAINNDEEYFMRRIEYGQLLRIGLTHKRTLFDSNTPVMHSKHRGKGRERKNDEEKEKEKANLTTASSSSSSVLISDAFCYIDQFRNTNDVLSACILSSYIPGLFGPARAIFDRKNLVVRRACETLSELTHLGAVKFAYSDEPVEQQTSESPSSGDRNQSHEDESATDQFWDGGLSNVWPTLDDSTVIVSPISGIFEPNPSICPSLKGSDTVGDDMSKYTDTMKRIDAKFGESGGNGDDDDSKNSTRQFSWHGRMIYMDRQNAETVRRMTLSSDDDVLQARFQRGYNDARFVPSR